MAPRRVSLGAKLETKVLRSLHVRDASPALPTLPGRGTEMGGSGPMAGLMAGAAGGACFFMPARVVSVAVRAACPGSRRPW